MLEVARAHVLVAAQQAGRAAPAQGARADLREVHATSATAWAVVMAARFR